MKSAADRRGRPPRPAAGSAASPPPDSSRASGHAQAGAREAEAPPQRQVPWWSVADSTLHTLRGRLGRPRSSPASAPEPVAVPAPAAVAAVPVPALPRSLPPFPMPQFVHSDTPVSWSALGGIARVLVALQLLGMIWGQVWPAQARMQAAGAAAHSICAERPAPTVCDPHKPTSSLFGDLLAWMHT